MIYVLLSAILFAVILVVSSVLYHKRKKKCKKSNTNKCVVQHIVDSNNCVCCGEIVPEGYWVCLCRRRKWKIDE